MSLRRNLRTAAIVGGAGLVGLAAWRVYRTGEGVFSAAQGAAQSLGNIIKDPAQAWRDYQREGQDFIDKVITGDAYPEGAGTVETEEPLTVALNNPGAIRYNPANEWRGSPNTPSDRGVGGGFEIFNTADEGARAQLILMRNHMLRHGNTIRALLNVWAPSSGSSGGIQYSNSTDRYIQQVSFNSGFGPDQQINPNDRETMIKIAQAMAYYEAGGVTRVPDRWRDLWFWRNAWGLI